MATLAYTLGAPAQRSPQEETLVSSLAIVLGRARAEQLVDALGATVEQRATKGASAVVVKALIGMVAINIAFWIIRYLWSRS